MINMCAVKKMLVQTVIGIVIAALAFVLVSTLGYISYEFGLKLGSWNYTVMDYFMQGLACTTILPFMLIIPYFGWSIIEDWYRVMVIRCELENKKKKRRNK